MSMQPHQADALGKQPKRSHHASRNSAPNTGVHPQRKYVADHLRGVAAKVEQSQVAHAPMTPTERHNMRQGLKHAREHVAATTG